MSDNPYIPLPADAPWDPSFFLYEEASVTFDRVLGHLLRRAPDSVADYLLFRAGGSIMWKSSADHQFIRQACEVYLGLFDLAMKKASIKLMEAHLIVSSDYQGAHEAVLAAEKASETPGLNPVQRAEGLLSYYARLFESWKLLAAVPALAKEIFADTAGADLSAADYVAQDRKRRSILSLAAVLPGVAPHPINILARGVDPHIRNAASHQGGLQVQGRNPPRFVLRDRRWTRVMTQEEIEAAVAQLELTVSALQIGLVLGRANYPDEYGREARKYLREDDRYGVQFVEMAAAHNGFEAMEIGSSDSELKFVLRLSPGAHSREETEVTQYRRREGQVTRSVRTEPAFVWSTNRQVIKVLSLVAAFVGGKDLEIAVRGRDGEDLGRFSAPAELTSRLLLSEGLSIEELLQSGDNRLVDRAPFDEEMERLKKEEARESLS